MGQSFYGWFVNKIDAKGRVSVPAPFRQLVASPEFHGMVATPSFKHAMIEGSGIERMDWMQQQLETMAEYTEDYEAMQALFGETIQIPFDGEGRIVLPQPLLAHANLSDIVLFSGAGNVFQIWEPKAYEDYKAAMREHRRVGGAKFQPRRAIRGEAP